MNDKQFPGIPSLPQRPNLGGNTPAPNPVGSNPSVPRLPTQQPSNPSTPPLQGFGQQSPVNPLQGFGQQQNPSNPPQQQGFGQPAQQFGQQPQQQFNNPVQNFQNGQPTPTPRFDTEEESNPASRSVKLKRKKNSNSKKEVKATAYSGKRRNVMIARIAIFAVLAILVGNGVINILPKSSNLTASDSSLIISQVRQNLNVSDFPRTKGEGVAQGFTNVYLNYNPATKAERFELLKTFGPEKVISAIDIRPANEQEIAASGLTFSGTDTQVQTVTQGPYVVDSLMFKGGKAALITTMTQINNKQWVFLQIPLYYNTNTQDVSVSGPVTFGPPNGVTDIPANEGSESWNEDREVADAVKEDLTTYMKAWTSSDQTNIDRYLVKENGKIVSSLEAQEGLGSSVNFISMNSISVEAKKKPEEETTASMLDYYTRQAEIKVTFMEPASGIVYQQTYRLLLRYINEDWFVEDIQNVVVALDRDAIIRKNNEK